MAAETAGGTGGRQRKTVETTSETDGLERCARGMDLVFQRRRDDCCAVLAGGIWAGCSGAYGSATTAAPATPDWRAGDVCCPASHQRAAKGSRCILVATSLRKQQQQQEREDIAVAAACRRLFPPPLRWLVLLLQYPSCCCRCFWADSSPTSHK
jgi:hypothetical protein